MQFRVYAIALEGLVKNGGCSALLPLTVDSFLAQDGDPAVAEQSLFGLGIVSGEWSAVSGELPKDYLLV